MILYNSLNIIDEFTRYEILNSRFAHECWWYMDVDPRDESEGTKSKTSETKKITWTDVPKRFRPVKIERTTHWKKGQSHKYDETQ